VNLLPANYTLIQVNPAGFVAVSQDTISIDIADADLSDVLFIVERISSKPSDGPSQFFSEAPSKSKSPSDLQPSHSPSETPTRKPSILIAPSGTRYFCTAFPVS
jgi:hypothetical protein